MNKETSILLSSSQPDDIGGAVCLCSGSLQSIARELVEQVQLMSMFGSTKVDTLLVEMLLVGKWRALVADETSKGAPNFYSLAAA